MVERSKVDEVLHLVGHTRELSDGDARALDGKRGNHDVHPGAIGKASVDHGRGLIDPATNPGDNPVDHLATLAFVLEDQLGLRQPAAALSEDRLRPVDHDLAYLRVL